MPRLSDTMEEGTVARWVKHEGDHVVAGDVIAEIDTDKATMELTAFEDGVLLKILVAEGESAAIRSVYAAIHEGDPDAGLITIKYLEALQVMANGTATKIILPTELAGIAGAITGITAAISVPETTTLPQEG